MDRKVIREKSFDEAYVANPAAPLSVLTTDADMIAGKYDNWLENGFFTSPPPPAVPPAPPGGTP